MAGKGREPVGPVERQSPCDIPGVVASQNVQHDHREAEGLADLGEAAQAIDKQVAAIALAREGLFDADHRDVGCGDTTVSFSAFGNRPSG